MCRCGEDTHGDDTLAAMADWRNWRCWMRGSSTDEIEIARLQRRIWRYWLERAAAVLGHGPPTGLYDAEVRGRFQTFLGS